MSRDAGTAVDRLFNSPLEAGLRAVCTLVESFPKTCDIDRLMFFDYLLVHSSDVEGAPPSLHPPIPNRAGAVLVRRKLIAEGIQLMSSRGIVCARFEPVGITYQASEIALGFLRCLEAGYTRELRERARWMVAHFADTTTEDLRQFVEDRLGRWGDELGVRIADYEALE